MFKKTYVIVLTEAECRLAYLAFMQFRYDVVGKGLDPTDINELILRITKARRIHEL